MTEQENQAIREAFAVLRTAIQQDHGYAWSWHSNLVMSTYDVGCDYRVAHAGAARFMQMAFGIDTAQFAEYQSLFQNR